MTKHTPTPWEVDNISLGLINSSQFRIADCNINPILTSDIIEANARHIVKCVNVHEELVEVVKEVNKQIDTLMPPGITYTFPREHIIAKIKQALSKCKEE